MNLSESPRKVLKCHFFAPPQKKIIKQAGAELCQSQVMLVVEIFSFFTTSPDGRAAWWAAGEINTKANSVQLNWGLGWAWQNDGKVG